MSERITQICPCPSSARAAFYVDGHVTLSPLTCLAIIEKGANQEVCYMETIDNEVKRVDTEHKDFLGLVDDNDVERIRELGEEAKERHKKELVKSK
jgi:hypothetical protein